MNTRNINFKGTFFIMSNYLFGTLQIYILLKGGRMDIHRFSMDNFPLPKKSIEAPSCRHL
ncbi:hypothetical protein [Ascidiimonas sp. W6]|uniref:hypothetical protein n=1 Tax=Ascidiimonas meishanensis TaxID=3128903 RepID=UPI0030EB63FC